MTFLSFPGLDNIARTASFLAVFFSTASITSSIIVLFRLKADMDRVMTSPSGEGLLMQPVRHFDIFYLLNTDHCFNLEEIIRDIPSTRVPCVFYLCLSNRHFLVFLPRHNRHKSRCDHSSLPGLHEVDSRGSAWGIGIYVGSLGFTFPLMEWAYVI